MKKDRVLKWLIIFFIVMVGLTIMSRITYRMLIPKVVLGTVEENVIEHQVSTRGKVTSNVELPVFTAEGLLISSIYVTEGQKVKEGTVLYGIDQASLNQCIQGKQLELNIVNGQIEEQKQADPSANLQGLEAEQRQKREALEIYTRIRARGGAVKADRDGIITAIYARAGEKTTGNADMMMADKTKGVIVSVSVDSEGEGHYITTSTVALISDGAGGETKELPIRSLSEDEEKGTLEISIALPDDQFQVGQIVEVNLKSLSSRYQTCVPRTALHLDENNKYYVYGIKTTETILGEELTTVKYEVEVLDKNADFAAVKGVEQRMEIIVDSDKILEEGIKVRQLQ
ncbi:MAG: biotin/lipoyl-binding protein [Bacillota bacterium]|nr:biotin/lipoyl-binding protein [Bacillota bacterium]